MKDSTQNKTNGRYVLGGVTEVSTRFIEWWERNDVYYDTSDIVYVLEDRYVGRLDRLMTAFYGNPQKAWMLLMYNNIIDADEELVAGKILLMPTPDKLNTLFKATKLGGIPTTAL
jgi:hypothetical protein